MLKMIMTTGLKSCIIEHGKISARFFRYPQTTRKQHTQINSCFDKRFKIMKQLKNIFRFSHVIIFNLLILISSSFAQVRMVVPDQQQAESEDFTWWYALIFLLSAGLVGAFIWFRKDKQAKQEQTELNKIKKKKRRAVDDGALDLDSELEWYRKNKKIINKKAARNLSKKVRVNGEISEAEASYSENLEKKMHKLAFSQLPISRFDRVEMARPFTPLPLSNDEALMSAIEQTHDEFEEDENVRDLAVRILARFKTRNSVEALSQVALYDLSSALRSKAVGILSDFDHESVFETLLLACADPTREVKAAAARGLFRLSFDRTDCWMRITESGDEYRMRHAARAAIAGDLVERSFDRLAHEDRKIAYEVFALINLLLKSGETEEVFNALENHRDPNVRKGILQVIKITKEHNALDGLYSLLEKSDLSEEMRAEIDKLVEEIGLVPV